MTNTELAAVIKNHLASAYPNIEVKVEPWRKDPSRIAVYFVEEKFSLLYPQQRYHYLIHNLPEDFYQEYLTDSVWIELAPGEKEEDLRYPDDEVIADIDADVMALLTKSGFLDALDDAMAPEIPDEKGEPCQGDFRITKRILVEKGFREQREIDEVFDICHVLMSRGAFCDCEVLYNVDEGSRFAARYWKGRADDMDKPNK